MPNDYLTVECHACRRRVLRSQAGRVRDMWFHQDSMHPQCIRLFDKYQRFRNCSECNRLLLVEDNGKCPRCNGAKSARELLYNV